MHLPAYAVSIGLAYKNEMVLGGDLRRSTPFIMASVEKAMIDEGLTPINIGRNPSPTVLYYAMNRGLASVMVTGSHIPEDQNGIKYAKPSGEVLKSDEQSILENVALARLQEYIKTDPESQFQDDGKFKFNLQHNLSKEDEERVAREEYKNRLEPFRGLLEGVRIGYYIQTGVGSDIGVEIYRDILGADVHPFGRKTEFFSLDTETVRPDAIAEVQAEMNNTNLDIVITTDGDSDRPLMFYRVYVNGKPTSEVRFVTGDILGLLTVTGIENLGINIGAVAMPETANPSIKEVLHNEQGKPFVYTNVGSPYVIAQMNTYLEMMTDEKSDINGAVVGWESNGGFMTATDIVYNGQTIKAIPSRDAMSPMMFTLALMKSRGVNIQDLLNQYQRYFVNTATIKQFPREVSSKIIEYLTPKDVKDMQEVTFNDDDNFYISILMGDATVKVVSASHETALYDELNEIKRRLEEEIFTSERGFDRVKGIAYRTNTPRAIFRNGEVSHLRPSGNAPELRNYAVASTLARAQEITKLGEEVIVPALRERIENGDLSNGSQERTTSGTKAIRSKPEANTPIAKAVEAVKTGVPMTIHPYKDHKVWGVQREDNAGQVTEVGEDYYGAEAGAKSSLTKVGDEQVTTADIVGFAEEEVLGEAQVKNFNAHMPLVKILTPAGRLSVQSHDTKDELWIITGIDEEIAGDSPSIILGFSKEAVAKYGREVAIQYGRQAEKFGTYLNNLKNELEKDGYKDNLTDEGDILEVARNAVNTNRKYTTLLELAENAQNGLNWFYNYRPVKVGEAIPISTGTLHALGAGIEIIEPQVPGDTQSYEDGATYPVRYAFPGYETATSTKTLDIARAGDLLNPTVAVETKPVVIENADGIIVEQLPGGFENKGLQVNRIKISEGADYNVTGNNSFHTLVLTNGEAQIYIRDSKGKQDVYNIPLAQAGGTMLIVPASAKEYTINSIDGAEIIDTFTPMPRSEGEWQIVDPTLGNGVADTGVQEVNETVMYQDFGTGTKVSRKLEILQTAVKPKIIEDRETTVYVEAGQILVRTDQDIILDAGEAYTIGKGVEFTIARTDASLTNPVVRLNYTNTEAENFTYDVLNAVEKNINVIQALDAINIITIDEMYNTNDKGVDDMGSMLWEQRQLQQNIGPNITLNGYNSAFGGLEAAMKAFHEGAINILQVTQANLNKYNQIVEGLRAGNERDKKKATQLESFMRNVRIRIVQNGVDKDGAFNGKGWYFSREVKGLSLLQAAVTTEDVRITGESTVADDLEKIMARRIPGFKREFLYGLLPYASRESILNQLGDSEEFQFVRGILESNNVTLWLELINRLLLEMPMRPYDPTSQLQQERNIHWSV